MLFYKFQKPGNLEFGMLRRGEIFFASPSELNDANECRPRWILSGNLEHWKRLADWILTRVCFGADTPHGKLDHVREILMTADEVGLRLKRAAKSRNIGLEELGQMFSGAAREPLEKAVGDVTCGLITNAAEHFISNRLPGFLGESKYMSSFSLQATNPTMWGHYAAAEKGFVLVYRTRDNKLNVKSCVRNLFGSKTKTDDVLGCEVNELGIYDELSIPLRQVEYRATPPKVNALRELVPHFHFSEREEHYDGPELLMGEASEKEGGQIGLIKSTDWRYENEVRAFFPNWQELAPDERVLSVDINNFVGVVFGARMSLRDRGRVCICCHHWIRSSGRMESDICLFQAEQVKDKFDFIIKPVGIVDPNSSAFRYKPQFIGLRDLDSAEADHLRTLAEAIQETSQVFVAHKADD